MGVNYKLFWHLSPKKLKAFNKAYEIKQKSRDADMLIQASYIYEAFSTVMANSFGKQHIKWRNKTYTQEYEESHRTDEEIANANGMAIMKNLELSMSVYNATHSEVSHG